MIHVRFQPAADLPWVRVDVPDDRLEAVLKRAGERVFPGPVDPELVAAREKAWQDLVAERARREKAAKK